MYKEIIHIEIIIKCNFGAQGVSKCKLCVVKIKTAGYKELIFKFYG